MRRLAAVLVLAGFAIPVSAQETRSTLMVKLQREFPTQDADRNGWLSPAEALAMMGKMALGRRSMTGAQLSSVTSTWFARADADRNGRVTPTEGQMALVAHFNKYDANRDGRLSVDEQNKAVDLILQGV